jgi:hypothetical protein
MLDTAVLAHLYWGGYSLALGTQPHPFLPPHVAHHLVALVVAADTVFGRLSVLAVK